MRKKTGPLVLVLSALATVTGAQAALAADNGELMFRRYCFVCHDTHPGKNKVGPSLAGVVGRKAGTAEGFGYSPAMQGAGFTWDEKMLDEYLSDPRAKVPGNKMLFLGVKNPQERHAIIEYLERIKS
jgi:cytochrome c